MNDTVKSLHESIKHATNGSTNLPYSLYSSYFEQKLLNVPIVKPLLIVLLKGEKSLGANDELACHIGDFIFLAASSTINMRNIPQVNEYAALLIEFDENDFAGLSVNNKSSANYVVGETSSQLVNCLQQFVDFTLWAPKSLWSLRKREILELLCHMGHEEILSMINNISVGQKLHNILCEKRFMHVSIEDICAQLAMSESTLRRKLKSEGTSLQYIKDHARMGLGLHLLQTTQHSISFIADSCGYQSQSRFTDRFKAWFGLTPSELRKTKVAV